jgi:hypothetical protein
MIRGAAFLFLLAAAPAAFAQSGVSFGLVTISTGQTIRVNAVNLGTGTYAAGASSCGVTVQLLNPQNQVVTQSVLTITPGNAASLQASRDTLPGLTGRIDLRAVLLYGYAGGANPPPKLLSQFDCNIVPTLEVFDNNTGQTSFILTAVTPLPAPASPPPQ